MRTTLDLQDSVFRRLKARAALEGISMKDLLERYITSGLQRSEGGAGVVSEAAVEVAPWVSAFESMQDGCGMTRAGTGDLATNSDHMEGFGRG